MSTTTRDTSTATPIPDPHPFLATLDPSSLTLSKLTATITPHPDPTASTYPAALQHELTHYRALFSALRFNYLEQVTKEKFLRGIVEEPSLVVEAEENESLEVEVLEKKRVLAENKAAVESLLQELEKVGRKVVGLYEEVVKLRGVLEVLPGEVEAMEEEIREMGVLGVGLAETMRGLAEARGELAGLERELRGVEEEAPRRRRELGVLEGEVARGEGEREGLGMVVGEAVRERERREREGKGEREGLGMWYKGSWEVLSGLIGDD